MVTMAAMTPMAASHGLHGRSSMAAMAAHGIQPSRFLADGRAFMGAMGAMVSVGATQIHNAAHGPHGAHTPAMLPES